MLILQHIMVQTCMKLKTCKIRKKNHRPIAKHSKIIKLPQCHLVEACLKIVSDNSPCLLIYR